MLQECENGYDCKEFVENKSCYGDTVMSGQAFYSKPSCTNVVLEQVSKGHPNIRAAELPSKPSNGPAA